jgi:hypothetical protein
MDRRSSTTSFILTRSKSKKHTLVVATYQHTLRLAKTTPLNCDLEHCSVSKGKVSHSLFYRQESAELISGSIDFAAGADLCSIRSLPELD